MQSGNVALIYVKYKWKQFKHNNNQTIALQYTHSIYWFVAYIHIYTLTR